MWVNNIIDSIKLPFRKEKELFSALYDILGFYPHDISLYKQALLHKSVGRRNEKGRPQNNERLEFLGDAILDAVVGDIVFRHFEGKREGFLTNARSKLVSRATLGKLAQEMGIDQLIKYAGHSTSHNSYMNGNAFEALVGAIYLDRGYDACMRFMEKRILAQVINIDKVAYKEVNFKSKLLEWSQKNRVKLEFRSLEESRDDKGSPVFTTQVFLEGLEGSKGTGYSKKESQQQASKETLQLLRREPQFIDSIFAAKADRTKMEEEPVMAAPDIDKLQEEQQNFIIEREPEAHPNQNPTVRGDSVATHDVDSVAVSQRQTTLDDELTLDDITATPREKSREEIIAEAEAAAFAEAEALE
ncbi:MAG: ribonuclease III [Prevotella sp.]|jgi:ribonuclease-3|nr:ribonuclease III [Prevotella sp.]